MTSADPGTGSDGLPLAIRLPNWVGDVCMALPTLLALRKAGFAPRCLGRGWAGPLLSGSDITWTGSARGVSAEAAVLRATSAKHGLLFTNSLGTALAMRLAGIGAVGYRGEGRSLLLRRALRKEPGPHEVEHFWALGAACCQLWMPTAPWDDKPPRIPALTLSAAQHEQAAAALVRQGINDSFIALCPLAVGSTAGLSKVWPHWRELARHLHVVGHRLVTCPGPGEVDACAAAAPEATILPGLDLGVYAAVLARSCQVLANDSGPMHLAAAVGAPVLGIFGPGDPHRTGPWGGSFLGGDGRWPTLHEVLAAIG